MTDQIETRIDGIRQYAQDELDDENTRADDAQRAEDILWLVDQLTAARESIRDARAQEQENQDVARYLDANPTRPRVWPPATPENSPSLTDNERGIANVILSREGQRTRPVTVAGSATFPSFTLSEQDVAEIMSRYYWDQTEARP